MEPGTRLGHYEILAPLGEGGMGAVYRARDTTLERDVAIKVLPEGWASDPDRLARFEREAKLLASVNHPNIATIHGFEEFDGVRFIAMEVAEGKSLADRITADGRIRPDEALDIARQIALALEAAHAAGVIHRDMKPANVHVAADGTVKVLDLGLAKAYEEDGSASEASQKLSESPTMMEATRAGVIMGTAPYMSPEQARGKPVDKRTDIWSFGCVLLEMLTGQPTFAGETVSDVIAAILEREPDWDAVPDDVPWRIVDLLRQCLVKNADGRLHDIADARIGIVTAIADPEGGDAPPARSDQAAKLSWRRAIPTPVAAAMVVVAAVAVWVATLGSSGSPAPPMTTKLTVELPSYVQLQAGGAPSPLAISPDGRHLVYGAQEAGVYRLYLRRLDELSATPLTGSEGGYNPFFSPDGQWIGAARGELGSGRHHHPVAGSPDRSGASACGRGRA